MSKRFVVPELPYIYGCIYGSDPEPNKCPSCNALKIGEKYKCGGRYDELYWPSDTWRSGIITGHCPLVKKAVDMVKDKGFGWKDYGIACDWLEERDPDLANALRTAIGD
ncbi:hypothetical protein C4577_02900 [Candidatus Parcubacteria bacterium]|nr:MAG: hypothetical protein C4577_02900 [Candidatus Parcubacteria bacterium]